MKVTNDRFVPGDWNAACYRCGRKRKASEMKKQWQGYYVCPEHWEPRHPQEFAKGVTEQPAAPWVQNRPEWVPRYVCDPVTMTAIPDKAIPDCAMPEYISPSFYDDTL